MVLSDPWSHVRDWLSRRKREIFGGRPQLPVYKGVADAYTLGVVGLNQRKLGDFHTLSFDINSTLQYVTHWLHLL
jgi:hypothetical protein